jgi:hypothetical protein
VHGLISTAVFVAAAHPKGNSKPIQYSWLLALYRRLKHVLNVGAGSQISCGHGDVLSGFLSHFGDFHVIVVSDADDRDDQAGDVNRRKFVIENAASGDDRYHFLENAAYTECHHGRTPEQGELGGNHAECQASREDEKQHSPPGTILSSKFAEPSYDVAGTFNQEGNNRQGDEHDWR